MLVLSRREGESVCVGDGVVVTVVRICGNRVRVGVEAENKPILRVELKEKEENDAFSDGDAKKATANERDIGRTKKKRDAA